MKTVFNYYNCNPHHKHTNDCVIRAISAGTGDSWEEVLEQLTEYMVKTGDMINTPELYGKYLADIGWIKQKQPIKPDGKKIRIKEFVQTFKGCAIVHAGRGHISYVAEGKLWDIWNCEDEVVGNYWTFDEG